MIEECSHVANIEFPLAGLIRYVFFFFIQKTIRLADSHVEAANFISLCYVGYYSAVSDYKPNN